MLTRAGCSTNSGIPIIATTTATGSEQQPLRFSPMPCVFKPGSLNHLDSPTPISNGEQLAPTVSTSQHQCAPKIGDANRGDTLAWFNLQSTAKSPQCFNRFLGYLRARALTS